MLELIEVQKCKNVLSVHMGSRAVQADDSSTGCKHSTAQHSLCHNGSTEKEIQVKQTVTYLNQQGTVLLQPDPLPVGQRQQLVVVHDRVHALHPQGVHVTIKQNVLAFVLLRWPVDLTEDV